MSTQPFIFISYAREDGEHFATDLRQKLAAEFSNDALWQDRVKMRGSLNWWHQITEALDNVRFMVLVATPAAMASKTVQKEWRYARQQGVWVYPVKVPASPVEFGAMPRWMSDGHFYDLDKEWQTFLNDLQKTDRPPNVPFMPPDMPEHFVERPDHFNALVEQLLDDERDNPVAITTSLTGAGGFGKTTLAAAICHDEDVQTAFDDGVLWVTLGEKPDLVAAIAKLYDALTDELPDFVDVEQGARRLAEKLADRDCLIVIDDVWNPAHVRPFLRGGDRCARLITTRFAHIAVEANAKQNTVDEMTGDQAVEMLLTRIDNHPDEREALQALAQRLGEWPLMLEIANGILRERLLMGNSFERALEWVERKLDKRGVRGIRRDDENQRKRSAYDVLAASIELLEDTETERLFELAIFREDAAIPITSVMKLWDLDDFDSEDVLMKFTRFSLIKFNPENSITRLHDVVRQVLESRLTENTTIPEAHNKLVTAYGDLTNLPDTYAWMNIAHHLACVMDMVKLSNLLLDFNFLQNKLNNTNPNALISDCDFLFSSPLQTGEPNDMRAIYLVQSALRMSAHVLITGSTQLASHLIGRLLSHTSNTSVSKLLSTIKRTTPWIKPLGLSLEQAGGPLVRTFSGHEEGVTTIAVTSDDKYIVSGSKDCTIRIWDLDTGEQIRVLQGHENSVNALALTSDDMYIISGSSDDTLRIWNLETGEQIHVLQGHENSVYAIAVTSDDRYIVSGSKDCTIRIWNLQTGEQIRVLQGHENSVMSIAVTSDDKYIISGSEHDLLRKWNLNTGMLIKKFGKPSNCLAVMSHKNQIISGHGYMEYQMGDKEWEAEECDIYFWDIETGEPVRKYTSRSMVYRSLYVSSDNHYLIVGTGDGHSWFEERFAIIIFNAEKLEKIATINVAHSNEVLSVASSRTNKYLLSSSQDGLVKIWNINNPSKPLPIEHSDEGTAQVLLRKSGKYAISASEIGQNVALWDVQNQHKLFQWRHHKSVASVAFSPDGRYAISNSRLTIKVVDIIDQKEITELYGGPNKATIVAGAVLLEEGLIILVFRQNVKWYSGDKLIRDPRLEDAIQVWDLGKKELKYSLPLDVNTNFSYHHKIEGTWASGRYTIRNLKTNDEIIMPIKHENENQALRISTVNRNTLTISETNTDLQVAQFTMDFQIMSHDISENGYIVVGDKVGHVFFLQLENYELAEYDEML